MKEQFVHFFLVLTAIVTIYARNIGETIPFSYPLFKQCGESWSNDLMVNETICAVGCLMSSTSMALRGHNISIDGQNSDPGVLNQWLRKNAGYTDTNGLYEEVIYKIAPDRIQYVGPYYGNDSIPWQQLKDMLNKGVVVIANVMLGGHFVLIVGYDEGNFKWFVNDPGFNKNYYTSDDIVGYRVFLMT